MGTCFPGYDGKNCENDINECDVRTLTNFIFHIYNTTLIPSTIYNTIMIPPQYCRDIIKMPPRYYQDTTKILPRYYQDTNKILPRYYYLDATKILPKDCLEKKTNKQNK